MRLTFVEDETITAYVITKADANPTTVERTNTTEATTIKQRTTPNTGEATVNAKQQPIH